MGVGVEINLPLFPELAPVGEDLIFMVCTSVTTQQSGPPPWKNYADAIFFSCNPRCAESESETRLINFKVFWFLVYTFDSVCLCLSVLHQPAYLPYCVLLCLQHNGVLLFTVFPHVPAPVQVLVMLYCWTRKSFLYSSFNYLELDIDSR